MNIVYRYEMVVDRFDPRYPDRSYELLWRQEMDRLAEQTRYLAQNLSLELWNGVWLDHLNDPKTIILKS
jgi:hypothetical protein